MGTRGAYGFRVDGEDKVTYNHFDSYPEYLGKSVLEFVRNHSANELTAMARRIRLVSEDKKPLQKEIEAYSKRANQDVSSGRLDEWYVLLRNTQGDLSVYEDPSFTVMIDSQSFLGDSLFCEWAYIINLDEGLFEVYKGFNKKYNARGRYASKGTVYDMAPGSEYTGIELIAAYGLDDIPTEEEFLKDIQVICGEEVS